MDPATQHIKKKINWAYLTIAAVAHSIRYDSSLRSRTIRSSLLVLFRLWQACDLPFATQNLRYLRTPAQIQIIQTALTNSLQRILRSYTIAEILLLEFCILPLRLQQACQLIAFTTGTLSATHTLLQHTFTASAASSGSLTVTRANQSKFERKTHIPFSPSKACTLNHTNPRKLHEQKQETRQVFCQFPQTFCQRSMA